MTKASTDRHSFILRIWRQAPNRGWRGWVQHTASGKTATLRNLFDLLVFIERYQKEAGPAEPDEEARGGDEHTPGLR